MTFDSRVFSGSVSRSSAIVCLVLAQVVVAPLAVAQDYSQTSDPEQTVVVEDAPPVELGEELADEPLFAAAELEELVAPIALYPDPLLIQVLIASTYPLDIVRAQRWLEENPDIADEELIDKAELENWDPSIVSLAPFPTVIEQMATNLDWTETLGDAMALQSDDVLDAVQVMRALAQANGVLESGEKMTVTPGEDDTIIIEPTNPEVVYVPAYDTQYVYASPPATTTATVVEGSGSSSNSSGNVLAAGIIGFGLGVILTSIYKENRYDYYWGPSHGSVNWHFHTIRPPYYRPGIGYRPPYYRPPPPGYQPGTGWRPRPAHYREARRRTDQRHEFRHQARDRAQTAPQDRAGRLEQNLQRRGRDQGNRLEGAKPVRRAASNRAGDAPDRPRPQVRPGTRDTAFSGRDGARARDESQRRGQGSVDRSRRAEPQVSRPDRSRADRVERPQRPSSGQQRQRAAPKQGSNRPEAGGGVFQRGGNAKADKGRGQKSAGKLHERDRSRRRGG